MTTKKIPISFNDEDQGIIKDLIKLMGIEGVYGDIPKAVKFGIKLAHSTIENPQKVYSGLDEAELSIYFNSVHKAEVIKKNIRDIERLQNIKPLV